MSALHRSMKQALGLWPKIQKLIDELKCLGPHSVGMVPSFRKLNRFCVMRTADATRGRHSCVARRINLDPWADAAAKPLRQLMRNTEQVALSALYRLCSRAARTAVELPCSIGTSVGKPTRAD
jgi:hypothetical protein